MGLTLVIFIRLFLYSLYSRLGRQSYLINHAKPLYSFISLFAVLIDSFGLLSPLLHNPVHTRFFPNSQYLCTISALLKQGKPNGFRAGKTTVDEIRV